MWFQAGLNAATLHWRSRGSGSIHQSLLIERCQIGSSDPLPLREAGTPGHSTPEQTGPRMRRRVQAQMAQRHRLEVFILNQVENERISCR